MATMKLVILAVACVSAYAFPDEPTGPVTKNTIFADEKFEGQIFEDLDSMEQSTLSRNTDTSSIYRLPNTTAPRHYNILWQINITSLSMSGSVDIILVANQANVSEVILQALDLSIVQPTLLQGTTNIPVDYSLDAQMQFLYIRLRNGVLQYNSSSPVEYRLTIAFSAPLRTDMYGIYRSWYRNNPSNISEPIRWMASTQFQATYARAAFPCYDEPSFKATFDITIRRPTAFGSWSCTRQNGTRDSIFPGYQEDVYSRTPMMSTYLLALIVAEYRTKENIQNNQLMYEVIARPGAMSVGQGDYAFDVGQELLARMSEHTALDFYSVNSNIKMTQAAIPDFGAGAMENWGLLTYREAYVLYDENNTNSYFKQLIAYILSHEIAHMWFGNLVTCNWWDVLWLNEGFARYYQYFLTNWVEDQMGFEPRFIVEQVHTALLSDSANNPHPLSTTNIGSPSSVSGMFSTISYNKGAAIIRMTEHLLGTTVHTAGLRQYLDNFKFQNALPIDLFESLEDAARRYNATTEYGPNFSFIDYYNSWTEEGGHPVLNVQVNHRTGMMTVYQRRFNINTGYAITNNNNYIVPVSFATASNPNFNNTKPTHIISQTVTNIPRGSVGDEWVVFNKQQTGFYRVNYDDYTWDLIAMQLRGPNREVIHEYNRAQIVNDVFQFARSGLMTYTRAFNILSFLENETAYAPWVAALTGFSWVRNRLAGTPDLANVERLLLNWSTQVMQQLTYYPSPNETFITSYLRYQLAPVLCLLDAPGCRTAATAQFQALVTSNTSVPVDSRNWVYCSALRTGTTADFDFLWTRFQRHNVYTEKILLLMVLGCTPHQSSLNTFLDGIVHDNYVIRPQDYTTAYNSAVTSNEGNTQIVFQYIQQNLANVTSAFGSASSPLSYISSRLRSEAEILQFQTWANSSAAALGNEYQSVYNGARSSQDSLDWARGVSSDLAYYFSTGTFPLQTTTQAPTTVSSTQTVPTPSLTQPVTPNLPAPPATDSATSVYTSMLIVALAVIINIFV